MVDLPRTGAVPVVRADFADDARWDRLKAEIASPTEEEGFLASVEFVDDRRFEGVGEQEVRRGLGGPYPEVYPYPVVFVVDAASDLLVVDTQADPEPSFRATPRQVQAIENNLSIANMDFFEFAGAAGEDGVFRGFD